MPHEQRAGADEERGRIDIWCPQCSAQLASDVAAIVEVCPACGSQVDWDAAIRRSRAWIAVKRAEADHLRAQEAVRVAADEFSAARRASASAWYAQHSAEEAWRALNRPTRWAPPALPATPRPDRRPGIPLAVLLQGTGAVLLLAALTTASAVLWEAMPEALQILTLLAAVALVGAVTVVARPLPATSVILAVLTAASGVVVASSLPQIAPGMDGPWYAPVASFVGTASLLAAGRRSGVSFWWRSGWIGLGLTGVLAVDAALAGSTLEAGTTPWFALATVLLAAVAVPLLAAAVTLRTREAEAAATSWWTAMAVGVLAVASGLAGMGNWLADLDGAASNAPLWVAAGFLALAGLGYLAFVAAWLTGRTAVGWFLGASMASLAVLPSLAIGAAPVDSGASAVIAVAPTTVAAAAVVWVGWRWREVPGLLTAVGAAAAVLVGSALLVNLVVLGGSAPPAFAWLMATLTALAVAVGMWGYGALTNRGIWASAGLVLGSAAWFAAWATGHLGAAVEVVTLSVLAGLLGSWWLGIRLDLWRLRTAPAVLPQLAVLACLLPTVGLSLLAMADGQVNGPRIALVVGGLAAVTVLALWQGTGVTLPAVAVGLVSVAHTWVAVTERLTDPALEWYSLPVAAAVALVGMARVVDRGATPRAALAAALTAAFVPSAVAVLVDPTWGTLTAGRLGLVVGTATLVVALAWRWPPAAWAAGTLGLTAALRVYVAWAQAAVQAPGQGWAPLEVLTLPAALVIGASVGLAWRVWDARRAVSAGATAAVATAAASSLGLVAADLLVEQWDTGVRVLALLTAAGLLAVLLDAAAPVRSAVAATALVVLPLVLYGNWLAGRTSIELEAATIPLAVSAALVLGWIQRPARPGQWWLAAVRPAALALLLTSTVWAVMAQMWGAGVITWIRATAVTVVWAGAAVAMRNRPPVAAASGAVAVLVLWANVLAPMARADVPLEAFTWPTAAAVAAWCALGAWATKRWNSSWLVAAPAVGLATIPTAAVAWQDGTVGWRVWFALIVGGLLVAVGSRYEWAGLVYPGLASLGLVTVPVLVQWAQDLPGWVPLSLVGVALLLIGARLEAARRRGGQLRHWVAHLH